MSGSDSSSGLRVPSIHPAGSTFHCSRGNRALRSGYFAMILTGRSLTGVPSTITVTSSRTEITPIKMKVSRKVLLCLGNSVSLKLTIIHMNPRTKQLITVKEKNRDPAYQVPLFQILNGHAAFRRQRCYV